ncbi:hypothetical protein DRJ16_07590, partial [Candidatus Woesearchaeota archaeon]
PKSYHWNPWVISSEWIDIIRQDFGVPDVVNFHSLYIPFQAALSKLFINNKWPYIISSRGTLSGRAQRHKKAKKWFGNHMFAKNHVKEAMALHALCAHEAEDIREKYKGKKILIVSNGVDEDMLENNYNVVDFREYFGVGREVIFGFLGRIDIHIKGIDILLEGFKGIEDAGVRFKLAMAGPFDTKKDEISVRNMVKTLKHPGAVSFKGELSGHEKYEFLSGIDVFVHTSRTEGFPNAVIEAMACGKPVVVTPGTNMKEVILESGGGWVADGSVQSLSETLISVIADPKEIAERGVRAKKYIQDELTWDKIAKEYAEKLSAILAGGTDP